MNNTSLNKAYVTVLTSASYLMGCVALDRSLKTVNSKYPLIVVCPDSIDKSVLASLETYGIQYSTMENLPANILSRDNNIGYWNNTLFKIKVFDLISFEKIVFLDTDMIILNNIDHLFDYKHMSAVAAGAVLFPEWSEGINSGLMVIVPNHDIYLELVDNIEPAYNYRESIGLGFGDQDIIKRVYPNWGKEKELHLPEKYNTMLGYGGCLKAAGEINSFDDIFVYHFTGKEKPWNKGLKNHLIILLKIFKRAKLRSGIDISAYKRFRKILKAVM